MAVKTQTTSNNLPVKEVSKELALAADNFNLERHLVKLLIHEPFFSTILRKVSKFKSDTVPTAGVTIRDGEFMLLWNPKFLASLETKEIRGLLKHESYHLIFSHCSSRKQEPHKLWNVATDLAINSLIPRDELPDGGLVPGEPLDLTKCEDPAVAEEWQKVSDLIESLPKNEASEWYMQKLKEDKDVSETLKGEEAKNFILDDHDGWGDLSEEERQVAEAQIKEAVKEAVRRCDRSGNWGTVSQDTRDKLRKMISDAIDWKRVIQNFCGNSQRANKARTHKRINRKYPYIHPGVKRGHSATVAVYMDQSGSVGDEDVELFFGCLNQLGRITTFLLYPFDWSVNDDAVIKWRKGQSLPSNRVLAGGTSFDAVESHVKDNLKSFDGHIILTDGGASDPGPSLQRRCWVLLPGCRLPFKAHRNDIVVEMERQ